MQDKKPWRPNRPISKGATAYHDAVSKAEYYVAALDEFIKIITPKINQGDVVVDFGAGTGVSALRLLAYLKVDIELWLVDNSPAWLGKAHEVFGNSANIKCYLLEKKGEGYETLAEAVGSKVADHVISAHTVHLIPDIENTFLGIADALKDNGTFSFLSGNIPSTDGIKGALLIDDTVKRAHDIAIDIVRTDSRFANYRNGLNERIKMEETQRRFVFPNPRPIGVYLNALKKAHFKCQGHHYSLIKVNYSDWLNFLRVRRLQAGILPEIGGHNPSQKEEIDRDILITEAAGKLFKELQTQNPLADDKSFTIEYVCVLAQKTTLMHNKNDLCLRGKNALVTGSSRGIGKAIAIELAKNGANIILNYNKNEKEALEIMNEIKDLDVDCIAIKADVSNFEEVKGMFNVVGKKFGKLDILVNNAGIIMDKTLQNMSIDDWNVVMKTNLKGTFNVTKNALPLLNENGRIINVSSIVALDGNFGQTNYAASKAGIIGFTKSLAKELGKYGITVNAIAPGLIETDIIKSMPSFKKEELSKSIPLGRSGTPKDVANLVVFLASDKAGYITGDVISIDGGLRF